jgi:hypothetical protein
MKYYNFSAFLQRHTIAIRLNLQTDKRVFVIKRACSLLNKFDEYLQHQAITSWSNEFRISPKMLQSYINGEETIEFTNTELLREFLNSFIINENEISGQLDIERNAIKYTYDELTILVEDEGLRTYNLKKLLKSSNKNITVVNVYNPLNILFKELANKYKGEPIIHQLSACVKAYNFGDKENGFYQDRLDYYFHKWICKAAGQALHISANDVMLLWVEPLGGSGKSYLNQWLFSLSEIKAYYLRISENESFMDMKGISKAKFAIDWDELPLSRKRYISFKSHIAAESGQQYNKHKKIYEPYTRQVNFIGSTNKANREKQNGYLLDEDTAMMRRIAPIEIEGRIDYSKYTKDISLEQLWGQAACEILKAKETNNTRLLSWECDYEDLRFQNSRYINSNIANLELILTLFPRGWVDNGIIMTSSQMLAEFKSRGIKTTMNEWEFGKFLADHDYFPGRNRNGRGWWIRK